MEVEVRPVERDVVNPSEKRSHIFKILFRDATSFEHETRVERNSLEDADHLRLFQRPLDDFGGMLRRGDLERRDKAGERLPC